MAGHCPRSLCGDLEMWQTEEGRLTLFCDECDAQYPDPNHTAESDALTAEPTPTRPATPEEIEAAGWTPHIQATRPET